MKIGDKVLTVQNPDFDPRGWLPECLRTRRWSVVGMITAHHDSHGESWEVQHDDNGTIGHYETPELVPLTIQEPSKEQRLNAAGYFLRDDTLIRTGVDPFKGHEEAYSLCSRGPFQRHHVYAGSREWAVAQAYKFIFEASK